MDKPRQERNEKDNRDLSNTEFSFKYTESGVCLFHIILKQILSYPLPILVVVILEKTESDEHELKEIVKETEFFKTRTDYPPEKEDDTHIH